MVREVHGGAVQPEEISATVAAGQDSGDLACATREHPSCVTVPFPRYAGEEPAAGRGLSSYAIGQPPAGAEARTAVPFGAPIACRPASMQ
jgi:hypothetical protein